MRDLGVGIDIGTTAVKIVALSPTGEVVFESSIDHPLFSDQPGCAEEDATLWWASTQTLLKRLCAAVGSDRIAGIACSGMVPAVVLLDGEGRPVRRSIQQNDSRAGAEIARWKQRINEDSYFSRTGNTINQQVVFPKIDWVRTHEPEVWERTASVVGSYDYVGLQLTGMPTLELNWALESGMWLLRDHSWDPEVLNEMGLPKEMLPEVRAAGSPIGGVTRDVSMATGIDEGTPVFVGIADHVSSAFAMSVIEPGDILLKLGGAGDVLMAVDSPVTDPRLFIDYHPIAGRYLLNGCMASSGSIVRWLLALFGDDDTTALTRDAELLPPGSHGLVALPYFLGEKTPIFDVDARGVFFGLTLSHGRAHLFRAILEAVAFGFMHHIEVLRDIGMEPKRVVLSNGGARSPLWKQIVLDVIGMPGWYAADNPGSCVGAAAVALQSAGVTAQWEALARFSQQALPLEYSPSNHSQYKRYYAVYRQLYSRLQSLFPELRLE